MRRAFAWSPLLAALAAALPLAAADDPKKDEPAKLKLSDDEKALLDLTNAERAKEKLPPLEPNPLLFEAARGHSANMLKKGEMKHELDGKSPKDRIDKVGYDWRVFGENIAWGENTPLPEVMKGWMDSKVHRENILNRDFTEVGIGIATNDKGEAYYTQVFAKPRKK
jgi:uncharacterized protein YkwD